MQNWGEAIVEIAGQRRTVYLFLMRACYSGAAFVIAFERQSQQAFLEAHVEAFRFFGGVFQTVRYDNLRSAVKQRLPALRERAYEREEYSAIDWAHTQAFAYGTFGNIVVNVRGREESGTVSPGEEYERVRDAIAEQLLELRAPAGERMVAAVHRREDLFEGPHLDKVPDLLVEFSDYAWLGKGNLKSRADTIWDRIEIEPGSPVSYVGSHRHEGIVALEGPSVVQGVQLSAQILDVAPTLLYLLGRPVPSDLEGRVLVEAIEPSLLEARPLEYEEPALHEAGPTERYGSSEAAEVEERLRGLGYLE